MRKTLPLALMVAIIATAAGYAFYKASLAERSNARSISALLELTLPDFQGTPVKLSQWRGNVLVVNFWATWCEPCREEIPALIRMQSRFALNGLRIVGIAIDSADNVREFNAKFGVNYPLVIGGVRTIDLARDLGNHAGALPYTLVIDRKGIVISTRLGGISEAELERAVKPLL
jgi:thiol-disulfide isomerase/thioredoxin